MEQLVIMDTAELFMKRKSDGHIISSATMQLAGISQAVSEEDLRGGIGNGRVALLRTDKDVTLNTRDALWSMDYLAVTQGVKVESGSVEVNKTETVPVTAGKAKLTGTPVGKVFYTNDAGETVEATPTTGEVTLTGVTSPTIKLSYKQKVTGDMVRFDTATFAEKYELELHTIAYTPSTMKVQKDIYIQFDEVIPSGSFDMSFEAGSALAPEMELRVMNPEGKTEIGRIVAVDRA